MPCVFREAGLRVRKHFECTGHVFLCICSTVSEFCVCSCFSSRFSHPTVMSPEKAACLVDKVSMKCDFLLEHRSQEEEVSVDALLFKTLQTKPFHCIPSYYVFACGCELKLFFFLLLF